MNGLDFFNFDFFACKMWINEENSVMSTRTPTSFPGNEVARTPIVRVLESTPLPPLPKKKLLSLKPKVNGNTGGGTPYDGLYWEYLPFSDSRVLTG